MSSPLDPGRRPRITHGLSTVGAIACPRLGAAPWKPGGIACWRASGRDRGATGCWYPDTPGCRLRWSAAMACASRLRRSRRMRSFTTWSRSQSSSERASSMVRLTASRSSRCSGVIWGAATGRRESRAVRRLRPNTFEAIPRSAISRDQRRGPPARLAWLGSRVQRIATSIAQLCPIRSRLLALGYPEGARRAWRPLECDRCAARRGPARGVPAISERGCLERGHRSRQAGVVWQHLPAMRGNPSSGAHEEVIIGLARVVGGKRR